MGDSDWMRWRRRIFDGDGGGPCHDATAGPTTTYESRLGSRYSLASDLDAPPRVDAGDSQASISHQPAKLCPLYSNSDILDLYPAAEGAQIPGSGSGLVHDEFRAELEAAGNVEGGVAHGSPPMESPLDVTQDSTHAQRFQQVAPEMAAPLKMRSSTVNDEMIAQALQEEFSNLANLEARRKETKSMDPLGDDFARECVEIDSQCPQSKHGRHYGSGSHDREQNDGEVADSFRPGVRLLAGHQTGSEYGDFSDFGLVTSQTTTQHPDTMGTTRGSTSAGLPSVEDDDHTIALVLAEELAAQEEVAKRLHHMDSIPHVPKINGLIPTMDAASEDHQRLLERLYLYGLCENKIQGDGNCQFRALSDQLYRTPEHHKVVRKTIVERLKSEPDAYEGYVPMKYGEYLKKMSRSGEWGDHVTLQAAADHYGVRISLVTSFKDTCFIQITPSQQKSNRVIWLSFWSEVHYNSIYPEGDVPDSLDVKKKKHWLFPF